METYVWAPSRLKLKFVELHSSEIPSSFNNQSIAILSDINGSVVNLENAVSKLNTFKPDMIIFVGNLLDPKDTSSEHESIIEALSKLSAPLGKFAITSNQDSESARNVLITSNFIIVDTVLDVYKDFKSIALVNNPEGIDLDTASFNIGLSHDPFLMKDIEVDIVLGGKYHLGQVNLPMVGSLLHDNETMLTQTTQNDQTIFQTSGVGTNAPKVRFLSNPDVLILTLKSSQ